MRLTAFGMVGVVTVAVASESIEGCLQPSCEEVVLLSHGEHVPHENHTASPMRLDATRMSSVVSSTAYSGINPPPGWIFPR